MLQQAANGETSWKLADFESFQQRKTRIQHLVSPRLNGMIVDHLAIFLEIRPFPSIADVAKRGIRTDDQLFAGVL